MIPGTPHLIVIAGPTASGKTKLAIEVAKRVGAEIISADSQQVYRSFDIGMAKPSAEELAAVPHHLVSCVEPPETFSAARYLERADAIIKEIASRGKRVVISGGTGLYIRTLLHGVVSAPAADAELRHQLESFEREHGEGSLHQRLIKIDPETAKALPPTDMVRIIRAIEIFELSGIPASKHRRDHGFANQRYPFNLWVLNPNRERLYETINARTKRIFEVGLVAETKALIERGFLDTNPMKAVGYVQARKVLSGAITVEQAIEEAAQKTRHYAKRQWTWFRKEQGAVFLDEPYDVEKIIAASSARGDSA